MSESAPEGTEQSTEGGTTTSGFTPPATQQELNRIISERVQRERAKYADYEDLRGKAAQIDQANEKVAEAEAALADVPAKVASELRTHLIALHGIEADDAELFLTASDPAKLIQQVQRLVGRNATGQNFVPREGTTPTSPADNDERAVARAVFGTG